MFIGIIGFLAFGVGVIWLITSLFTKKGFKKSLITIGVGFVLFIVGIIMDPVSEEQAEETTEKSSEVIKDTSKEDSEAEATKEQDKKNKADKAESKSIAKKEKEEKAKADSIEKEEAKKQAKEKEEMEKKAKAESEAKVKEDAKVAADKRKTEIKDPSTYKTDITYDQIARTPDDYLMQKVMFSGKVIQVMEGDSITNQLRVAINDNYDDVMLVEYEKDILDSRILENDYINIYGYSMGVITYESTLGGNITIPAISANIIEY